MEECDLLVVGNGFDLNCGFKTSYIDFLDGTIEKNGGRVPDNFWFNLFLYSKNKKLFHNQDWCSIEACIFQIISFVEYLKTLPIVKHSNGFYRGGVKNFCLFIPLGKFDDLDDEYKKIILSYQCLPQSRLYSMEKDYLQSAIEKRNIAQYDKIAISFEYRFEADSFSKNDLFTKIINDLSSQLEEAENLLKKYISTETERIEEAIKNSINSSYVRNEFLTKYKFKKALNFNYSKTLERFFCPDGQPVFHVHGSTDSEVVLGTEDTFFDDTQLHSYFVLYKRWRRFYKDTNPFFQEKIIKSLNSESTIVFFGLSLDKTDYSILYELFNQKCKNYIIYFYSPESIKKANLDGKEKIVNLIGMKLLDELYKSEKIRLIPISF